MNMKKINDQLITFETAKLAKEKGFEIKGNQACFFMNKPEGLDLPTQSLLQRWLREKYKIIVQPIITAEGFYIVDVINDYTITHIGMGNMDYFTNQKTYYNNLSGYNSYDNAMEIGLQEALKLI